ncbi:hypothetical protein M0L20_18120 [Spirosoma sp. RP8]|uniref:Uncharacterized protein n=1 Tax=Spirosoma liriopis TaxID=2937440 RepID=A0ABT0HNP6_9BACT|nr:hypothetical protein [Spirosoma liriopis]MCK8493788.1 hypothetical protein [Spirosoma liriopis]
MKFFKVFLGLALFAIAGLVAEQTGNVLAGIASIPLLTYGFESFTGLSLLSGPLALYGALSPIKRPAQGEANPGGGRKLWLIGVDSIVGEWPKKGDIVDGEIINPPVLAASAVFIEVAVSDNSLKIDQNMKGSSGYQSWEQMIEVKIAGFNPV